MLRSALSRIIILFAANLAIIMVVILSTGPGGGPQPGIMSAGALAGQQVWQARNCTSCHSLYGLGGHIGPDLTNAMTRVGEDGARAILHYGMGRMPPQVLTPEEAGQVIAYLRYVDSTGVYPTPSFPDHSFGRFGKD